MNPPTIPVALEALRAAAEALYRSPRGHAAFAALERAEDALLAIRGAIDDPEVARAREELACAYGLLGVGHEEGVRSAANRLYASAVILLEPHRPWQDVHLMLLRVLLRDMLPAAGAGDRRAVERLWLSARAACRSLALDAWVTRSGRHAAIERALAAAARGDRPDGYAAHAEAAREALALLDQLEIELAAVRPVAAQAVRAAHGASGAFGEEAPAHGS